MILFEEHHMWCNHHREEVVRNGKLLSKMKYGNHDELSALDTKLDYNRTCIDMIIIAG